MKVCKKCGAEMKDESMFCGTCGTWQDEIQDLNQHQVQDDAIDNRITVTVFHPSKNEARRNPIVITAVVGCIILLGYFFFTSKFFTFAMIKQNPLGAFCNAVEKQQDLDSYASNINLFCGFSVRGQYIKTYLNIDSNVNSLKDKSVHDGYYSLKSGNYSKTITGKLYQDADIFYLKIPVIDKYIKSEAEKKNNSKEYSELRQRIAKKIVDAIKNKISNSDFDTSEETLEINNEKCNVVKVQLKLNKKKLISIFKEALLNALHDNKLRNHIKSYYTDKNLDFDYESFAKSVKKIDTNEAIKDINLSMFELDAYINKNNNLVGMKVVSNLEPKPENEQGRITFILQQRISKINELDNIKLPADLSANSKDAEYCLNTYPYSDEAKNYFAFSRVVPVDENTNLTVFKINAKLIQTALDEFHAENDRYPEDKDEFENCMKNQIGIVPAYDDGTEIVDQYINNTDADSYNITFNDNKNTITNEALLSMNGFTNVDNFK